MDIKENGATISEETHEVKVVVSAAPTPTDVYNLAQRTETEDEMKTRLMPPPPPPTHAQPSQYSYSAPPGFVVKRRRGRPRKYGPDLSPYPISSSLPRTHVSSLYGQQERAGATASGAGGMSYKYEPVQLGEKVFSSVGSSFTPHLITVHAGEDVMKRVISFSQEGPRSICILSASGAVSNVTLRQPDSSGGTLTYQGRLEIVSLSGSFVPCDSGEGLQNRAGGMSISLARADGQVIGGGVAGYLIAASPIQIVVASFLTKNQQDVQQNPRNTNTGPNSSAGMHDSGRYQDHYGRMS